MSDLKEPLVDQFARPVECRRPDRGRELAQDTDTIPEERVQKRIILLLNLLVSDDSSAAVEQIRHESMLLA
jgi:hypothetical protein